MSEKIAARLHSPGPKRMLALDGGGTRGIISIAFLEKIEATLRKKYKNDTLVLADYFDMIGGTSVGSLLATMLALGWDMAKVRRIFETWAPDLFSSFLRLGSYDARTLVNKLRGLLKDMPLGSDDLKTGLTVVTKRSDTNSVWVFVNNPASIYWQGRGRRIGNKDYLLRDILRAATAAPTYYSPTDITLHSSQEDGKNIVDKGRFIDGAVSPHNNPSLQLFMLASIQGYNLGGNGKTWELGPDKLLMISVGTGSHDTEVQKSNLPYREAVGSLMSMMGDAQQLTLTLLQGLSVVPQGADGQARPRWLIDSEIGTMAGHLLVGKPHLTFQRYDVPLDAKWLSGEKPREDQTGVRRGEHIEKALKAHNIRLPRDLDDMCKLINVSAMAKLYALAQAAAEEQVSEHDFPDAFGRHATPVLSGLPRPSLIVGVTGHRPNRLAVSFDALVERCQRILVELPGNDGTRLAISSLAEGADRAFAEAALAGGYDLHGYLPFKRADYETTFADAGQLPAFHALLDRARNVTELSGQLADSKEAYVNSGQTIIDESDVMVGVWDGAPAAGKGGTPEIIEMALRRGKPVIWVDASGKSEARILAPDGKGTTLDAAQAAAVPFSPDEIARLLKAG